MNTPDDTLFDLPASPAEAPATAPAEGAPAPRRRGRPRKNPLPAPESAAPAAPAAEDASPAAPAAEGAPAPRRRGRPRKNPLPAPGSAATATAPATEESAPAVAPVAEEAAPAAPATPAEPVAESAPAVAAKPVSDEAVANSIASLFDTSASASEAPAQATGTAAEEWSPAVLSPSGKPYLPAETTRLEQPKGEEWAPPAEPRAGDPPPRHPAAEPPRLAPHEPYPADADPMALAASVQPSETLKAALAGKHLSNFEMRRLTRRERAYLRTVQHGGKIDYATFVARGIANAQRANAVQAQQQPQRPQPAPTFPGKAKGPFPAQPQPVPGPVPLPREALPEIRVADLQLLDVKALLARAEEAGIADDIPDLHKHDVIYELLRNHARRGGAVRTEGILEIAKDGSGFLRNRDANYQTSPEDAQVPPQLIRKFGLRPGQLVAGPCRAPENATGKNRFFVLSGVDTVNGLAPHLARRITPFENQTPLFPDKRIVLETAADGIEMRVTDLFAPIGFGQRGLIVAPPRTGKTVIMQKMANAITRNYPDVTLIILLIDERPEEVTDMQRTTRAQVIASTFDEPPEKHVQVADNVIEMARRKVEMGEDVIILLDSITRLGRAYNTLAPTNGRILSGGVEATALQRPKRFFGSARNLENGGSLTIVATALIETGSRMDEVIFEEFKGTGNMELVLDRALADRRVFPAINVAKSGTRKEELLVNNQIEMTRTWMLRRAIGDAPPAEAMEMIISRMKKFPTNHDFLMGIQS